MVTSVYVVGLVIIGIAFCVVSFALGAATCVKVFRGIVLDYKKDTFNHQRQLEETVELINFRRESYSGALARATIAERELNEEHGLKFVDDGDTFHHTSVTANEEEKV